VDFTTPAIRPERARDAALRNAALFNMKLSQIIDFLVESASGWIWTAIPICRNRWNLSSRPIRCPRRIIENLFRRARPMLNRETLMASLNANFPDLRYFDEWVERTDAHGQTAQCGRSRRA